MKIAATGFTWVDVALLCILAARYESTETPPAWMWYAWTAPRPRTRKIYAPPGLNLVYRGLACTVRFLRDLYVWARRG